MRRDIRTRAIFTILILYNIPIYYSPNRVFQKSGPLTEIISQMKELSFIKGIRTYVKGETTFLEVVAQERYSKDSENEDTIIYKVFEYGYEKEN